MAGTYNSSGDDSSGVDTVCDSVICNDNRRVETVDCVECEPGKYNNEGDDAN